ncbi:hypothetical protein [Flavobacterium orientale]|uniref:Glycerophosphoryl diester phosphodiesterase membrane domain-containing protein n=1 Tax=Flavobacterium orientale TaxID=1756020 RepID=A0A917DCW7_9FLAO|nr:hypothetical protein [Flavobacterium orientale]GGD26164.1 hypothetical protein GCM10011343_15410 [Flavobacterium orientale]
MFQLFKTRNFSDYISDTFSFFKVTGRHYFSNYFIINGGFLLLLSVLFYLAFKVYFELIFSAIAPANQDFGIIESYFTDNLGLIIGLIIISVILIIFVSIINFTYPIIYLNLYHKNKGDSFTTATIIQELKNNFGKILLYIFKLFLISIPLILLLGLVMFVLTIIIIGIPLILIIVPAYLAWMNISLYVYLNSDSGFLNALGKGFTIIKNKFWPIVGASLVMLVIIQVILTVLTMIPYVFGVASIFTSAQNSGFDDNNPFSFMSIILSIVFVASVILNYVLNNIQLINSGIIYYSSCEEEENNQPKNAIEMIGSDHE